MWWACGRAPCQQERPPPPGCRSVLTTLLLAPQRNEAGRMYRPDEFYEDDTEGGKDWVPRDPNEEDDD